MNNTKILSLYLENKLTDDEKIKLHDNYLFMLELINYTNNCKYYYLTSNRLKTNYKFIKLLVYRFQNNINFITYISDIFLNKTTDLLDEFELNIILSNMFSNSKKIELQQYCLNAKETLLEILDLLEDNMEDDLNLKFLILKDEFISRPIILNYIATNFLKEIMFYNQDYRFKEIVNCFLDLSKLDETILNFIREYDVNLATYLSNNLELLDVIKNKLNLKSNLKKNKIYRLY